MRETLVIFMFPRKLGNFIASQREKSYPSRRVFAAKIGLSPKTVEYIENGQTKNPGIEAILAIAKGLKLSPITLLAVYEGKDPDRIQDPTHTLQMLACDAVGMLNHLPKEVMLDALRQIDPKLLAELLIQMNGEEAIRQDLEEAKRLHRQKKKKTE
jgi:transcriptional regulator with XRE-family HTH domain